MRKTLLAPLQDILEPATLNPSMVGEYRLLLIFKEARIHGNRTSTRKKRLFPDDPHL